jgi:poly-gamma-glutamate capsule biosynthesis protein CapA/YwtB (metallophosphatase superfamily)
MKILNLVFALSIVLALSACQEQLDQQQDQVETPHVTHPKPKPVIVRPQQHDTLCIAAVGDIMLGTSYPDSTTLPPDSARSSFMAVADYLHGNDITFGNLEGTLLDEGDPAPYKLHLRSKGWLFRMPVNYGFILKDAGFNLLSIANNHIGDFGDPGRQSTMQILDSVGIKYAGLLSHPVDTFKVNGVKYGFCAFAPNSQVEPLLDLQNAAQIIQQLKQTCDVVIVAFHGGGEGTGFEHVPFTMESFHGEKRGDVHLFAHNAIDAGADVVLGTGPHVSRAVEVYKDRFIAYSLGNFCTYRSVSVAGICGIAPLLKIYVNKKGEFLNGRIISVKQSHDGGLQPDTLNNAVKRIRMLTLTDFPNSGLSIDDNGLIAKNVMEVDSAGQIHKP